MLQLLLSCARSAVVLYLFNELMLLSFKPVNPVQYN